ncbi:hypothetical protein CJF32_00009351 [Rutstroemia sp. NJR-2017a WRK4]|nr:hypothetical protein CJF32_00009351 [Rutstroemia sp. NJR-2017a WRK4]
MDAAVDATQESAGSNWGDSTVSHRYPANWFKGGKGEAILTLVAICRVLVAELVAFFRNDDDLMLELKGQIMNYHSCLMEAVTANTNYGSPANKDLFQVIQRFQFLKT